MYFPALFTGAQANLPHGPKCSCSTVLLSAQAAASKRHLFAYACPSEPHTPSPSLGHSSSVRHLHETEPSKFPVHTALFLHPLVRSHGPARMKEKPGSITLETTWVGKQTSLPVGALVGLSSGGLGEEWLKTLECI